MCGIAGAFWGSDAPRDARQALVRMADALRHRGPDADGYWMDEAAGVGFAHRRLSIIDLDPRSNQPMTRGTTTIIFNGEIYNFLELREGLRADGYVFTTEGDAEVILALYDKHRGQPEVFLNDLRGMFAFAIWDSRSSSLFLARDPVGKKPLFYWTAGRRFLFGSEPNALLTDESVPRRVHFPAIDRYLGLGVVAGEETAFEGMRRLPAASYLTVSAGGRIDGPHVYWRLQFEPKTAMTEDEAIEAVGSTLDLAVRRRLISDVPLGAFLSGGVDSSLVVALMARHSPSRVKTFTVTFTGTPHDEAEHARTVANALGTEHTEIDVLPTADMLDSIVGHVGEPFAEYSVVPTYLMSQVVRKHITVALNGDGGDEALAGYELRHRAFIAAERLPIPDVLRRAFRDGRSFWPLVPDEGRRLHRARKFAGVAFGAGERRHMALLHLFTPNERIRSLYNDEMRAAIGGRDRLSDIYASIYRDARTLHGVDRELLFSYRLYLPDQLLVKTDRASMAHGLEMRSPFLDRDFIELCARLPQAMKISGGVGKRLLRKLLARMVPSAIAERPKHGFTVPVSDWIRGPLRNLLVECAADPQSFAGSYLNTAFVSRLVDDHLSCRRDHGHRLFALVMLELWYRRYFRVSASVSSTAADRPRYACA